MCWTVFNHIRIREAVCSVYSRSMLAMLPHVLNLIIAIPCCINIGQCTMSIIFKYSEQLILKITVVHAKKLKSVVSCIQLLKEFR